MYKLNLPAFVGTMFLCLLLISCNKDNNSNSTAPKTPDMDALLQLSNTTLNQPVPNDFLGFSFETGALTDTTYFNISNPVFINLIKNLGKGVIRIGGNTVDRTYWSSHLRNNSDAKDSVYTDDIDRFAAFDRAVGWKVIYGLNLGHCTAKTDANEAKYVARKLEKSIYSFEIGNEPDMYRSNGLRQPKYNYQGFLGDFRAYSKTIRSSETGSVFSGPATSNDVGWVSSFAAGEVHDINLLSLHYYRMGPAGNPSVTIDRLLTFDDKLPKEIQTVTSAAKKADIPFRMAECNSVYGGGQHGVSDVFAASLWGSEYLFYLAQNNVAGVNFHGGSNLRYSAIGREGDQFTANPLYYSMLLFREAAVKQFLNASLNTNNPKLDAFYFRRTDGKNAILIINKDENNNTDITIKNGGSFDLATVHELYAPSLTSTTSISLDGASVDNDGNWSSTSTATIHGSNNSLRLSVKAASAALIIIN
jgi:hypothetical protein